MNKVKLFVTTILLLAVCFYSSTASAKEVAVKSQNELVVLTETLSTIPAVLYHFKPTLTKRDMVALRYKLEVIPGVKKAVAGEHRVGVSIEKEFSRELIEVEVLKILSDHFKAVSVITVAKK